MIYRCAPKERIWSKRDTNDAETAYANCPHITSKDKLFKNIDTVNLSTHKMPPLTQGQGNLISHPPQYCQYATGQCDQVFDPTPQLDAFFLYPGEPRIIARAVEDGMRIISESNSTISLSSWRDMAVSGQIVFCKVCQRQRFSAVVVADVSTLNFNVLFEIGYAMGLGLPIIPIRDVSYVRDAKDFDELGMLDTFGYLDFENSEDLAQKLPPAVKSARPVFAQQYSLSQDQPLYLVKSPVATDGLIKLMSGVKKSGLRFRTFDPKENSRLSLQEAYKQVQLSLGVIAHLMSSNRRGSKAHNARSAFICGLAMASEKYVMMLQEEDIQQPIDYRDVVRTYTDPQQVQALLGSFIQPLYEAFQNKRFVPITLPLRPLETLDFGDVAAENEINALKSYFIVTAQYQDVRRGHARLVVGRKGSGKSAIFYGVRNAFWTSQSHLVLDLKPEGHQFTKLKEALLSRLPQGMQEHVLTAFWSYLLLTELAYKIVDIDADVARRNIQRYKLYLEIRELSGWNPDAEQGDFSERLLTLVDNILERGTFIQNISTSAEVAQLIYSTDIRKLGDAIGQYLSSREGVWLLFDNLDKGWPVNGAGPIDVLILRSLLDATRKLQRQISRKNVECRAVAFVRNDIYEHLLNAIPDKGKDTAIMLEWQDPETFKMLVHRRIAASTGHQEPFEQLWPMFFDSHVGVEETFSYLLGRTMMRPRDLLRLLRECVNVAVNRGRSKVAEADIVYAEKTYSEDQLQELMFEMRDVEANLPDILYAFIGSSSVVDGPELNAKLANLTDGVTPERATDLLLWFCFLGIMNAGGEDRFAYQYQYGVKRMLQDARTPIRYTIHPAFRLALGCSG